MCQVAVHTNGWSTLSASSYPDAKFHNCNAVGLGPGMRMRGFPEPVLKTCSDVEVFMRHHKVNFMMSEVSYETQWDCPVVTTALLVREPVSRLRSLCNKNSGCRVLSTYREDPANTASVLTAMVAGLPSHQTTVTERDLKRALAALPHLFFIHLETMAFDVGHLAWRSGLPFDGLPRSNAHNVSKHYAASDLAATRSLLAFDIRLYDRIQNLTAAARAPHHPAGSLRTPTGALGLGLNIHLRHQPSCANAHQSHSPQPSTPP